MKKKDMHSKETLCLANQIKLYQIVKDKLNMNQSSYQH